MAFLGLVFRLLAKWVKAFVKTSVPFIVVGFALGLLFIGSGFPQSCFAFNIASCLVHFSYFSINSIWSPVAPQPKQWKVFVSM